MKPYQSLIGIASLIFLLSSCNDSTVANLETERDELQEKLTTLESSFDDVQLKIRRLESEIDDFDIEEWKDNVPEVVDASDDLKRAVSDVEDEF